MVDIKHLKQVLQDDSSSFAEQLRAAVVLDQDYWGSRGDVNNLPEQMLRNIIALHLDDTLVPDWEPRKSKKGKHGNDGEDNVFSFTVKKYVFGSAEEIFIKGYFFTKTERKGVTIQSCHKNTATPIFSSGPRRLP